MVIMVAKYGKKRDSEGRVIIDRFEFLMPLWIGNGLYSPLIEIITEQNDERSRIGSGNLSHSIGNLSLTLSARTDITEGDESQRRGGDIGVREGRDRLPIVYPAGNERVCGPFANVVTCDKRKGNGKEGEEGKGNDLEKISVHREEDTEGREKMEACPAHPRQTSFEQSWRAGRLKFQESGPGSPP